jgi:hypothetical protein
MSQVETVRSRMLQTLMQPRAGYQVLRQNGNWPRAVQRKPELRLEI